MGGALSNGAHRAKSCVRWKQQVALSHALPRRIACIFALLTLPTTSAPSQTRQGFLSYL